LRLIPGAGEKLGYVIHGTPLGKKEAPTEVSARIEQLVI
jgi:hypothetical protein